MEFNFTCPHCGQEITATDEHIGVEATCPTCSQPLVVPAPGAIENASDPTTPGAGIDVVAAKTVSSKELAGAAWEVMEKSAGECYTSLVAALADTGIKLTNDDQAVLSREIIIAHMWAISKAISADTNVLDALDERYFLGHYNLGATEDEKVHLAKAAESELQDRYAAYYKASAADEKHARDTGGSGTLASSEMLQRFFPAHKSLLNRMPVRLLQKHIQTFIGSLLEFRKKYTIHEA